jgi:hypothetical protein
LSGHQTGQNLAMGGTVAGQQVHFCESTAPHQPGCEHYADGGMVAENAEIHNNPELSIDHTILHDGLLHALTKAGHTKSEDPNRVVDEHLDAIRRGRKELENHSKNILETKKEHRIESNPNHVADLKTHLEDLNANPHKLLELGGSLADSLPDHAGALGAKAAAVMNHLQAIKPKPQQLNPMSEPIPPTKGDESRYNRQLAIMQNPAMLYQGIKDGTLSPEDLNTARAVYPKLVERMRDQTTSALIDAKTQGKHVSYKHKHGLGALLGQPLDWSQSPAAAQAIIAANGTQQPQGAKGGKKKTGATAATLKQINKADSMEASPIEERQMERKP